MHDCRKTKEELIDLVFDEVAADQKTRLLAEVAGCKGCQEQYRSMGETLHLFDQTAEAALPEERYWPVYNEKLRVKLAHSRRPGVWQRLTDFFAGFGLLPGLSLSAAAALVLLALALGLWWGLRRNEAGRSLPVVKDVAPAPAPAPVVPEAPAPAMKDLPGGPAPQLAKAPGPRPRRTVASPARREARPPEESLQPNFVTAQAAPPLATPSFLNLETTRHLERAQLLLRSVRNARFAGDAPAFDVAYEKEHSRGLLYKNILLRRDAEARGNLPAEDLLGSLEPFLLDIANLPDRPSPDDVRPIKERMEKREIIAVLQVYSAQTAPPNY